MMAEIFVSSDEVRDAEDVKIELIKMLGSYEDMESNHADIIIRPIKIEKT